MPFAVEAAVRVGPRLRPLYRRAMAFLTSITTRNHSSRLTSSYQLHRGAAGETDTGPTAPSGNCGIRLALFHLFPRAGCPRIDFHGVRMLFQAPPGCRQE